MPSIVKIDKIEHKPDSKDINFHTEWKKDWIDIEFENIIFNITKEEKKETADVNN